MLIVSSKTNHYLITVVCWSFYCFDTIGWAAEWGKHSVQNPNISFFDTPHNLELFPNVVIVVVVVKKVKAFHTRYRALGPELIPAYRQSACRRLKSFTQRSAAITFCQACSYLPSCRTSAPFGWYSFYHPTEGRRLSRPGSSSSSCSYISSDHGEVRASGR